LFLNPDLTVGLFQVGASRLVLHAGPLDLVIISDLPTTTLRLTWLLNAAPSALFTLGSESICPSPLVSTPKPSNAASACANRYSTLHKTWY
jgi:hypothetical protein